jgi:hypothetical protein
MPIVDLAPPSLTGVSRRPEDFAVTAGEDDVSQGSDAPDTSLGSVALSALRHGRASWSNRTADSVAPPLPPANLKTPSLA